MGSYPMGSPLGNFSGREDKLPIERLKLNESGYGWQDGQCVRIGDYEWQPLLEQIDSFSFRGIALRKEARLGCQFWYAFKKVNGKTRKIYCGKSWKFYGLQYFEGLYQRFEEMKYGA
jgi:hypothetical protein